MNKIRFNKLPSLSIQVQGNENLFNLSCFPFLPSSPNLLVWRKFFDRQKSKMDCSICSSMPFILRPPRNTICGACYEGARNVITLMNKLENNHGKGADKAGNIPVASSPNSCKASSAFLFSCPSSCSQSVTTLKFMFLLLLYLFVSMLLCMFRSFMIL